MSQDRTLLVTTVKDEGPFIFEWVAYHKLIGFDEIFIYENDSSDRTRRILRQLQSIGAIQTFTNRSNKRQWQNKAYRRISRQAAYSESTWCMALDADEFLNIHVGSHRIQDLTAAASDADVMLVNWRNFGAGDEDELTEELVLRRFAWSENEDRIAGAQFVGFKSLFRTHAFRRPGIHMPKVPMIANPRVINGSGLVEGAFPWKGWRSKDPLRRALAQVNHYRVRDAESFLVKSARGSASHPDRAVRLKYWRKANRNEVRETTIHRLLPQLERKMKEMDEASGGRLFQLRRAAIAKYKAKAHRLRQSAAGAELNLALSADIQAFRESEARDGICDFNA